MAGIQYVSLFTQREKGAGTMLFYIGGDAIKWGGAAVFNISPDATINALDGNAGQPVAQSVLKKSRAFRQRKTICTSAVPSAENALASR